MHYYRLGLNSVLDGQSQFELPVMKITLYIISNIHWDGIIECIQRSFATAIFSLLMSK